MAMRLNTSLLILGLFLGSLAVAHASRELLDDKKEDKRKCYPRKHQKKCPRGKVEDCLKTKSYHGYVKVSKKTCFNDKYSKDTYAISYTNKEGHPACTDGYTDFYAKCNTYVTLYIVDAKYYNKNGKKYYLPKECKDKYNHYKPCSVCDYNSFKVKCKKEEEYKPYYPKDKEDKHEKEYKEKKDDDKKDEEYKPSYPKDKEDKHEKEYKEKKDDDKKDEDYKHEKEYKEKKDNDKKDEEYKHEKEYKEKKDDDKKDEEYKHEKEYKEKDDDKDKYKYKN